VTSEAGFPIPVADRDSAPFWDAAARGELRVQVCTGCRHGVFPPLPGRCPACRSPLEWQAASPAATVYSWIGVEHPIHEWEAALVPYAVVLAQLDDLPDVRIPCLYPGSATDLSLGAAGEVVFSHDFGPGTRPLFR